MLRLLRGLLRTYFVPSRFIQLLFFFPKLPRRKKKSSVIKFRFLLVVAMHFMTLHGCLGVKHQISSYLSIFQSVLYCIVLYCIVLYCIAIGAFISIFFNRLKAPHGDESFERPAANGRYLICLSVCLPACLPACLLICLSACLSVRPSVQPSIHPPTHPPTHPPIHPSIHLPYPTHPFIHLSIYLSIYLTIYRSIYLSIYLSIYQSIYLSIYPSIHPSIHPLSTCADNSVERFLLHYAS